MTGSKVGNKFKGVIPYDPVEDFYYINAIGSDENEAEVNFHSLADAEDALLKRLKFFTVKIEVLR